MFADGGCFDSDVLSVGACFCVSCVQEQVSSSVGVLCDNGRLSAVEDGAAHDCA